VIPVHLGLALGAAVVYAVSSLAYKRAFSEGAIADQAFVWNNILLGVVFLPLAFLNDSPFPWSTAPLAIITGLCFFTGHWLGFQALRAGDVSVVTPLLGTKVLFVVAATRVFFGQPLRWSHVGAALLTVAGVAILGAGGSWAKRLLSREVRGGTPVGGHGARQAGSMSGIGGNRKALLLALGCAASFGVCDALVQEWSPRVGIMHFIFILFATLALASLVWFPLRGRALVSGPGRMWAWLVAGAVLTAGQAVLITVAIAWGRDATGVNVVYALRGVCGLLLVAWVGHWFGNREREAAGGVVFGARMVGATLLFAAVVWVVLASRQG
jgi:drug/metabolite transporter (DMT)-like permease